MKKAIIYARYSSERQTEQSIEGQLRVCYEYAKENDLVIVQEYIDRATTGTNDNRYYFQKMLLDSEKSDWEVVLVYALDRFGRNSTEMGVNKYRLKKNGKILLSATEITSTNADGSINLGGILMENVLVGIAEYYSAELSKKIRRGLHESRLKGKYMGGIVPYGYYVKDGRLHIDQDKAAIVKYIFEEYANGRASTDIIAELTRKGLQHTKMPFSKTTVLKMLRLEKYTGIARYADGVYDNIFPQIISPELFEAVKTRLAENHKGTRGNEDYLLRGKLFCGYCGRPIQGDSGTSKHQKTFRYYSCKGRKYYRDCRKKNEPKERLEALILQITIDVFGNEQNREFLANNIMELYNASIKDNPLLHILQADKQKTETALHNLVTAIENGVSSRTTQARLTELEEHLSEVNTKILQAEHEQEKRLTKEQILEHIERAIREEPQALFSLLLKKVVLYDDRMEIHYKFTNKRPPENPNSPDLSVQISDSDPACPPLAI